MRGFVRVLERVLGGPSEVYVDEMGAVYYLLKLNDVYLNVVVVEGLGMIR